MSNVVTLNSQNFAEEVLNFKGVVLVDFYANWCAPCRLLAPEMEMLAGELKNNSLVKIAKVDSEINADLTIQYGIRGIPNTLVFKDGQQIDQIVGLPKGPNGEAARAVFRQIVQELLP